MTIIRTMINHDTSNNDSDAIMTIVISMMIIYDIDNDNNNDDNTITYPGDWFLWDIVYRAKI